MEKARASLVDLIVGYRKTVDHDITIVFDGYKNGMATEQVSFNGHVKVIYTRLGERADDVIKKTVSTKQREWIVVTADRDIADHAWAAGSVAVAPEKFLDIIIRHRPKDIDEPPTDEEETRNAIYGVETLTSSRRRRRF